MKFKLKTKQTNSLARTGILETDRGSVQTPVFMPVGTYGAVRSLMPWELRELGAEIILGNTYHLHLRPGEQLIGDSGGLANWNGWSGPILTDSGGYQAYSLGQSRLKTAKTDDEGVNFASHIDGKKLKFTPENVLDIQSKLGIDIAMVLDDCPPITADKDRVAKAVRRSGLWAKKSIDHAQSQGYLDRFGLFGIVQGGLHQDLRQESLVDIQTLPFSGIAIGGVAIESEGKDLMNLAVNYVAKDLDPSRPHYLMGVGEPVDIIRMVNQGIDMFDCVIPTRFARHGAFWLTNDYSRQSIEKSAYTNDKGPLDPDCSCKICKTFSRSYLRHLYSVGEINAVRALSWHNIHLLINLTKQIRESIDSQQFTAKFAKYLQT